MDSMGLYLSSMSIC